MKTDTQNRDSSRWDIARLVANDWYRQACRTLEAAQEYGFEPDADDDAESQEEAALDYLRDNTQVIGVDGGGVIIQGF